MGRWAQVKRGDKLAEWDPYTLPIITEREGIANYMDLVEGISLKQTDEATGAAQRRRWWSTGSSSRKGDLRPRITLRDKKGRGSCSPNGSEARYFLSVDAILSVEHGQEVHAGDVLARIPRETSKTRDITGGLPRVAELFEARKPKDFGVVSEVDGRVEFGKDYKTSAACDRPERAIRAVEYLMPKGKHIDGPGRRLRQEGRRC